VASGAQERADARVGEHIVQPLRGHMACLQGEETLEQAIDVLVACSSQIAVTGQLLELALLVAQSRAHGGTEDVIDRRLARLPQVLPCTHIRGVLTGEQREWVGGTVPRQGLVAEPDDIGIFTQARKDLADLVSRHAGNDIAAPYSHVEVRVLRTEKPEDLERSFEYPAKGPQEHRLSRRVEARDDEGVMPAGEPTCCCHADSRLKH
jgi:hypothetical protein